MFELRDSGTKKCSKCQRILPATSEYFNNDKRKEGGLRPVCKECHKQSGIEYYALHAKEESEYGKKYYAEHKNAAQARHNQYYRDTLLARRDHHRKYRETHKNEMRKYRESHLDAIKEGQRRWLQTEHGSLVSKVCRHRRRARQRGNGGNYTAQDVQNQYTRQKGKCYYCKIKLGSGKKAYHVDHVIPLARGGSNGPENLVIACPTCNLKKQDKLLHEWPEGGRLL